VILLDLPKTKTGSVGHVLLVLTLVMATAMALAPLFASSLS
jgi:hypothetical protein